MRFTQKEFSNIRGRRTFAKNTVHRCKEITPHCTSTTLKYLPPITYMPKYLIWLAHKRGIPDTSNVDTFISYLEPITRQCDFFIVEVNA